MGEHSRDDDNTTSPSNNDNNSRQCGGGGDDEGPSCALNNSTTLDNDKQNRSSGGENDTVREQDEKNTMDNAPSKDSKPADYHQNEGEADSSERMEDGNNAPTSQESPPCDTTNNASNTLDSAPILPQNKTTGDQNTKEGEDDLPAPNASPPHDEQVCSQENVPTTEQEEGDNNNNINSHNKTTGEHSADTDNPVCALDNAPPTGNTKMDHDNPMCVLDSAQQNVDNASTATNSSAQTTPRRKSGQLVKEESESPTNAAAHVTHSNKSQPYTHQLRTNTGTNIQRHRQKLQHRHSLDDTLPNNLQGVSDSEDDDFYPYAGEAGDADGGSIRYEYCTAADGISLPEFVGNDVNSPEIFKAPRRAAVHPNRPPFLELRPHPLRETQVGTFLRTIASTDTQLWAGQECGVRVWRLSDAYEPGIGVGGRARRGDEDAAPFYESVNTSPTMCLTIDSASKLVWSGHKDGRIRSWKMDEELDDNLFQEGLSWQAHRAAVLTLVISSYGKFVLSSYNNMMQELWMYDDERFRNI